MNHCNKTSHIPPCLPCSACYCSSLSLSSSASLTPLRWGILGCAAIALKIGRAILLSDQCVLSAVASRNQEKAKQFIDNLVGENVHKKCEKENIQILDYNRILDKNIVDILYIPLPSKMHKEWVVRAAEKGIHILCEKPAAVNLNELNVIVQACKDNQVQFMDGVMFMHHQRTEKLLNVIRDNIFGLPNRVTAVFSNETLKILMGQQDVRLSQEGDPLGCLGDLGWYCIRIGLLVFQMKYPTSVWCRADSKTDDGILTDVTGEVFWQLCEISSAEKKTQEKSEKILPNLSFQASFIRPFRQWVEILGNKKRLYMDDFVVPRSEAEATFDVEIFPERGMVERETKICSSTIKYRTYDCLQECLMIQRMNEMVRKKQRGEELEEYWFDAAIKTQAVCDALMESVKLGGKIVKVKSL